jgi:D-aminopeptidase
MDGRLMAQETTPPTRLRDMGIKLGLLAVGTYNAITDVAGVRVGHYTLRENDRPGSETRGPCNTGVTVIVPHSDDVWLDRVPAAFSMLNGAGEVTGREYLEELGTLDGPIFLTGTFNVPRVMDAVISEAVRRHPNIGMGRHFVNPFVAECSDAMLSDLVARPIGEREVAQAWSEAASGPVAEGSVGAGTGLVSFGFKAGIGTSSRVVEVNSQRYTVGVLVSANTGERELLTVKGIRVGSILDAPKPRWVQEGSIILIVATDAPMLSRQLKRLARRAEMGLARTGATASNGSGDFAVAFSTANRTKRGALSHNFVELDNDVVSPLFQATIEATEEALINALCASRDFVGRNGHFVAGLPLEQLKRMVPL